ncbi:MAG: hypothetical protein HOD92_03055 [Deltaproteobacteria bacterium]|nr:hypothetical protein [Deltaproteobacteria bacterium]
MIGLIVPLEALLSVPELGWHSAIKSVKSGLKVGWLVDFLSSGCTQGTKWNKEYNFDCPWK